MQLLKTTNLYQQFLKLSPETFESLELHQWVCMINKRYCVINCITCRAHLIAARIPYPPVRLDS